MAAWEADLERVREESDAARKQSELERQGDVTHTQIQGYLRDLGRAMGFDVWIASNDRGRPFGEGRLGDGCLTALPEALQGGADAIGLIDAMWFDATSS